jgi:hypothetical protein
MVIVVTGMVGLDKKSYLKKVCDYAGKHGKEVLLCNVGDMMYAEAPDIAAGKILDIPLKRLHSLRRSVFKDIISKVKKAPNLIVNTHATFRCRASPRSAGPRSRTSSPSPAARRTSLSTRTRHSAGGTACSRRSISTRCESLTLIYISA